MKPTNESPKRTMTGKTREISAILAGDTQLREALEAFAVEHGRNWRTHLWDLWTSEKDEGPLRRARNVIGPWGLRRIKF